VRWVALLLGRDRIITIADLREPADREDARVRLAVDLDRVYFFDSQSGRAIR
jgi:hypothetical protein